MLQGLQLSALPQVAPYPIRNPPRQRSQPRVSTATPAPEPAPIRFKKGDYVSPQCHRPQDIGIVLSCRVWVKVQWLTHTGCSREHPTTLKHRSPQEPAVVAVTQRHLLTPAQISPAPPTPKPQRRYSPKGKATGWIEERQGNQKRKTPSTSYYYCWQDATGKHKRYIKASKVTRVHQMVTQRQPTQTILDFLNPEAR